MTVSLGSVIWTSFKPMLKIYATIGVGFFFGKKNIFDIATSRNVSYINRRILLPCLMFSTIVSNLQYTDIKQIAITCFNSFLYMTISGILITAFVMVGLPLALPGFKVNSKSKAEVRTSLVAKSLQGWKYGMIFLMMFSNGPNLLIAYLQSLQYNTKIFSSDQINKGIGVVFLAFACFDFAVYCLGGYTMIGLDFKRGTAISCSSSSSAHKSTSGVNLSNTATRNISSSSSTDNNEHRLKMNESESSKSSNEISNSNFQQQQDSDEVESISSSITSVNEVEPQPFQNNDAEELQRQHSHTTHGGDNGISSGIATVTGNTMGLQRIVSTASQGSQQQRLRAIELRQLPSQNINDMVNEFTGAAHPEESIYDNNESASGSNFGIKLAMTNLKRWWVSKFGKRKEIRSTNVNMIYTEDAQAIPNYHRPHNNSSPNLDTNIKSNINDNNSNPHSNITEPTNQYTVSRFSFFTYHIFLKNLLKPTIITPLLSFGIAMIPWLKTLFVAAPLSNTGISSASIETRINDAPDEYPPLNIFMNYCSYLGSAQVPISLFLWGATLSRLDFLHYTDNKKGTSTATVTNGSGSSSDEDMDNDNAGKNADSDCLSTTSRFKETLFSFKRLFLHKNTIASATNNDNNNNSSKTNTSNSTWQLLVIFAFVSITKLCILPIVGISWLSCIKSNSHWFNSQLEESNSIFIFVLCCVWAMPSFNPHIYLTAYFTKPKPSDVPNEAQAYNNGKSDAEPIDYLQLNCLSCCLFIQYAIFFVSLPFVSSFVLKHVLHI